MVEDAHRLAAVEQKLQRATRLLAEAVAIVHNCKIEEGWPEYDLCTLPARDEYIKQEECVE